MKSIINAIKNIKSSAMFKNVNVINNTDKNGNKYIAISEINTVFSVGQLQTDDLFKPLLDAVDSLESDSITYSYTSPSKNKKYPGVGLLFIGKITETNLDDLSL